MRIFKKLLPFASGLCFFLGINMLLNYLIIPYQFPRMKIHRIETETFQDLILGTSHGSSAIDPEVLTEVTGRSSFNTAAGGQYPRDNYYLLADACRQHRPERVIIEYDPAYWISKDSFNRNARYQLDVMALSPVKLGYFKDLCFAGDIRYVLMPWFLYNDSFDRIAKNVEIKRSEAYARYDVSPFADGGQVCEKNGFTPIQDKAEGDRSIPDLEFSDENERYVRINAEYFKKTLQLCEREGIEAVVVTTPVPAETLAETEPFYREAHQRMEALAEEYDFIYLDYAWPSLAAAPEEEAFPVWESQCFSDGEGHMRISAAQKFTRLLAQELLRYSFGVHPS